MPHEPYPHEWAKSMIVVLVHFLSVGSIEENYKVTVKRNISIDGFMKHLKASKSVSGTLKLGEKELDITNATLNNCGISNGTQVSVRSYTPRKKLAYIVRVKVVDEEFKIKVSHFTKFSELAHMVQDECGMPADEQTWYKGGKPLKMSSRVVEHYDNRSKLPLEVKWSPKWHVQRDRATTARDQRGRDHSIAATTDAQSNTLQEKSKGDILKLVSDGIMSSKGSAVICGEMVDWKKFANRLNISEVEQREIEHDEPRLRDQKIEFLRIWRQRNGREAMWKEFVSACVDLNDHCLRDRAIELSHIPEMCDDTFPALSAAKPAA